MNEVRLSVGRSNKAEPKAAAEELVRDAGSSPKLAMLFANRDRDLPGLLSAVRERLPKATRLVGGTTGCTLHDGFLGSPTVSFPPRWAGRCPSCPALWAQATPSALDGLHPS
jgi:hypothetical protein